MPKVSLIQYSYVLDFAVETIDRIVCELVVEKRVL